MWITEVWTFRQELELRKLIYDGFKYILKKLQEFQSNKPEP